MRMQQPGGISGGWESCGADFWSTGIPFDAWANTWAKTLGPRHGGFPDAVVMASVCVHIYGDPSS